MTFEDIKGFRVRIDANIQECEQLISFAKEENSQAGRELALVRTKLQEAKMWAGKVLEVMGSPFPPELADKAKP